MPTAFNLRKLLHPKSFEMRTQAPVASAAGGFIVSDKFNIVPNMGAIFVNGLTSIFLYSGNEDSWLQLPNSGAAGTFGAGACGEIRGLGAMGGIFTQTATGGTTSTIITNRTIVQNLTGMRIRVVAGAGVGYDSTVTSNTIGANAVITVPTHSVAFDATTQYQIYSGSFWMFVPGAGAVGFSVYDYATNAWTARAVTGLPTTFGTDGALVSTIGSVKSFGTGTATSGTATTLVNTARNWGTNMWTNYQVRITGGTGIGQIRTISSNTSNTLTVSSSWTVNPDATSVYSIEGNDDFFYLTGSAAVAMYRFSVSGNTWSTLSPAAARAAAPGAGFTLNWIDNTSGWDNETLVNHNQAGTLFRQNGRYIYSFRGGASSNLDIYDIAGNTWISAHPYGNQNESFTTGSGNCDGDGFIYITKEATGRVFQFNVRDNILIPLATNVLPQGATLIGNKTFLLPYVDGGTKRWFLYQLRHTGTELVRMLLI